MKLGRSAKLPRWRVRRIAITFAVIVIVGVLVAPPDVAGQPFDLATGTPTAR